MGRISGSCRSRPTSSTTSPSYSPNGRWIYFERYTVATNDDAIWRMKTDGNRQQRVLGPFPNGFVTGPNVSPDGRKLSFELGRFAGRAVAK